jgi:integrase
MPKAKLDAAYIGALRCPPSKRKEDHYDTEIKGFVYEIRASGGGTFYLRYHDTHQVLRQYRIGGRDDITCHEARKAAQRLRSNVVLGGDPLAAKAEKRAVPTYAELADQHLAFARPSLRSYATMEASVRLHLKPRFGRSRIDQITEQDVVRFLADKADEGMAPASCERLRVILGRSFELAKRWGMPGAEKNPTRGVPRRPIVNARERTLTSAQIEALREAVARSSNTQLGYIVGLLILCGCRLGELLHARWEDVDLERRTWHVKKTKNGHARHVPLAEAAVGLLRDVPRFEGCPFVVPNPSTRRPFTTLKSAWRVVIKRAKLPGLRLHDLRHVSASLLVAASVDLYTVGKILGHRDYRSTQRYAHLANDTLLAAVEAGAAKLGVDWA